MAVQYTHAIRLSDGTCKPIGGTYGSYYEALAGLLHRISNYPVPTLNSARTKVTSWLYPEDFFSFTPPDKSMLTILRRTVDVQTSVSEWTEVQVKEVE